ncbi:PAS domain-containing protein [Dinghuibacter silviterrae]|uniref:histidine kinase n=1 Tax=Dinghuibacter silviterrae TaxID=1539049 RepID=A0A4R8DTH1_9BACT|nr:PAS domain S-box protein [Dinghuibacter silviterrae]TDX00717.1 PAS domain S-box-containing protein [Dinghuibacter silviterrae]
MKTLESKSDFYKLLVENSKEIICLQQEDGRILYVNPAFHETLGYPPSEVIGHIPNPWIHPDDAPWLEREFADAIEYWKNHKGTSTLRVRYRLRCRSQRYLWLHSQVTFMESPETGQLQFLTNSQDITFYMALEEELLSINRLSEDSSAMARIGGWQFDLETERLTWSPEVKRIHEVTPDYVPNLEEAIHFYAPEGRSIIEAQVAKSIQDGESWDLELPLITARGNRKWVRAQGEAEVQGGRVVRLYGAFQDITRAYKIKEQIRLNEQKFKAIFHAMFQFIGLLSPDGRLLEANDSALRFAGVELDQVLNRPFWEAFWWTESSKVQVKEYIRQAAQGQFVRDEISVHSTAGELLTLDFSIKPIFDDNGKVVMLIPEGRNITRQKRTEARLRLTQFSIDQASLPVIWAEHDGAITYINEYGCSILGRAAEELQGTPLWELYAEGTQEGYDSFWNDLKEQKVVNMQRSVTLKSGRVLEIEVTANYLSYGDQESSVTFFQDVTERIQAERHLVESEQRLRYALEGTGGGLWDWNLDSGSVYLSPIWKSMLGYQDTELENSYQSWYHQIHPEDKQKMLQTIQSVYDPSNNTFSLLHRLRTKTGEYRYILSKGIVIQRTHQGKPERIIGINSDLTNQIQTQEKLIETQQRFHHAFFNSGIGMAIVAPNGGWIDVNDATCRITGYSRTELLQLTFQDITHPDDVDKDVQGTMALLNGQIEMHTMEKRYIHKQGHTIWVNLNATVVRNKIGEPQFFVSHIEDITSLKTAQQSLERQNLRLISSAEHLTRKNKQLAEFSQIVSHNLRAPVSNISILLQYYKDAKTAEEKEELVDLLTQSSTALLDTLNELTEVIKVQQDKYIQKEALSFEHVFDKVKQMHAAQIAELKACIHQDFSAAPAIRYPSIYLESILMNLLNNALKYAEPTRKPVITVRTCWKNDNLLLEFSDNGRGINLDKHSGNIFKLYKTFHKHPDAKGLGLYMTKNQVEAMGGKIFVESKEFEGTKFIINFNQYQAPDAE